MSFLEQALVYLIAAVVVVPAFKQLGLGAVLGYLVAGVAIGPAALAIISDVHSVLHVSEFGVVLLLFVIGLELQPSRLLAMRRVVFGLGAAQVLGTTALLGALGLAFGLGPIPAVIVGAALAMSSTAFVLQLLAEKNELTRPAGQGAFGILLFQDLAAIPLLALVPLLGARDPAAAVVPWWLQIGKIVGVLVLVVLGGRYVLRPLFKAIAKTHIQELMTATALLVVVGTALAVSKVGLSMALGAFLAGVMLAESEYRHELEADLEPFKGLLLGLFFIAIGMSVELGLLFERPVLVVGLVLGLVALKALVLVIVGRVGKLPDLDGQLTLGATLSQGGEFAFVIFQLAEGGRILSPELSALLALVVTLSMATTPILYAVLVRVVRPRLVPHAAPRVFDIEPEPDVPVLVAGFGRVGQVVGRILRARRIPFTALDSNPEHIDFIKRFGNKVHYGDATRIELLRIARAEQAKVFVLAIDSIETSLKVAQVVKAHFPHLVIFARARNRQHAYKLLDLGIVHVFRDTFASSVDLTADVLQSLGMPFNEARSTVDRFREHDEALLMESYQHQQDLGKLMEIAARGRAELERLFVADEAQQPP